MAGSTEAGAAQDEVRLVLTRSGWRGCAGQVLALRSLVAPQLDTFDDGDLTGHHFLAWRGTELVAAVRANRANVAPLDFEPILTIAVPDLCREELVSLSRLVIAPREAKAIRLILGRLIYDAWACCWAEGSRASLVSATEDLIPFYRRTNGCRPVSRPLPHPRTGRLVRLLKHVPVRGGPSAFDRIADLPGPPVSRQMLDWLDALERADNSEA